jgi:hypothetical protein
MIRALRTLAISGLVAAAVHVLAGHLTQAGPLPALATSLNLVVVLLVLDAVGQTGFYVLFATGIVAIVACVQQRRRGWLAVFIILLVLSGYGAYLYTAYRAYTASRFLEVGYPLQTRGPLFLFYISYLSSPVLVEFIGSTLLAVLVLIYTFVRRPATAAS